MTTDTIAAAIDHIRSITPADNPWTADDVSSFSPWEPDESDYAIATILNAVVSGQLINRASRDEMLAQVRRGDGFATAGAEGRWIADSEAGVYGTDASDPIAAARAMIEPLTGHTPGPWSKHECLCGHPSCNQHTISTQGSVGFQAEDARLIVAAPELRDMVATLADALEAERAKVAAAYEAAGGICKRRYRDYEQMVANAERSGPSHLEYVCDSTFHHWSGKSSAYYEIATDIRALTPADAQAALDKLLAEARLEGWRAGRDAAARSCVLSGQDLAEGDWGPEGRDMAVMLAARILALPEPKEASHE